MSLNKQNLLASSMLLYLVCYDFLFFHLEEIFNMKLFIFKVYFEFITFCMFVAYFGYLTKFFKLHKSALLLTGFILFSFVYGIFLNQDIVSIVKDFRLFFLPIILSLLFYSLRFFEKINIKRLIFSYIIISIMLILYGFYEYIVFDGTVDSIWRYEFLLESKKAIDPDFLDHKVLYQVLRDGSIRVASLFISALDYSFYLATFGILIFIMGLKLRNFYLIPLFIIIIFSLYISQVRTGFILLFLGLLIYLLLNSRIKILYLISFFVPLIAILGTFLVMLFAGSSLNDASTLGRLVQYYQLINEFTAFGSGLGEHAFSFDSLYIYLFLTYGVFGVLFFFIQYWIINKLIIVNNNIRKLNFNRYEVVLVQFMIIYHLASMYLFAFHHTLGAPTFFILYFFSFIILSKAKYKLKKESLCE
tara:strand:+ start:1931 stop:3181 length:1251 start_codon:yes stop_codon:yes gene_type:complete